MLIDPLILPAFISIMKQKYPYCNMWYLQYTGQEEF